MKGEIMKKAETLTHWQGIEPNQPIMKHFEPVAYKARGSRYGACGIRIDGTPEFIDAVLSHLKECLDGENHVTRLELARNLVDGSKLGKAFDNASQDAEVCYIRLHQRGREGVIASGIFDKHLDDATKRYAESQGL